MKERKEEVFRTDDGQLVYAHLFRDIEGKWFLSVYDPAGGEVGSQRAIRLWREAAEDFGVECQGPLTGVGRESAFGICAPVVEMESEED